jgi:hypothetical protein
MLSNGFSAIFLSKNKLFVEPSQSFQVFFNNCGVRKLKRFKNMRFLKKEKCARRRFHFFCEPAGSFLNLL